MVQVPNELINNAGMALLAVFSLYMLFVVGEAYRTRYRGTARVQSVVEIVSDDTRKILGGFVAVAVGVLGWTMGFANLAAAVVGLGNWIGMLWFWFVSLLMSGLNVIGVTDFAVGQVLAAAVIFAVAAGLIRRYR